MMRLSRLLCQDMKQADFGLRRFRLRPGPARHVLESAARAFLTGLNAAFDARSAGALVDRLATVDAEHAGFAWEGAGMGAAVLDLVTMSGGRRVARLLADPAGAYPHLVHVGIGWAYARLRLRPGSGLPSADPLLRWLAWDGFGFHQGFFHADRVIGERRMERGLAPGTRAVRDQGLGRALWFHECAEPEGVGLRIGEFEPGRRADLWSGVGLAATYAGGADADELARLVELAGPHRAHLAQGSAFASKARLLGAVVPAHTELAARTITGAPAADAADWTEHALVALGPGAATLADYQRWRANTRQLWERQLRERTAPVR